MKSLTPIEALVENRQPHRVHYEITVTWPGTSEPACYVGHNLPLEQAAEKLEVLAEELRGAVKAEQSA